MTSSSNIAGDFRPGLKLRKVNSHYFSFKWKHESGESVLEKNSAKYKSNECTSDNSNDRTNANGFFKSLKKKLSLKSFYKSRRKIIATESNELEEGSSSLTGDLTIQSHSYTETYNNEIKDRIGDVSPEVDDNKLTTCSKNQTNDCPTRDYMNTELSNEMSAINLIQRSSSTSNVEAHVNNNPEEASNTVTDRLNHIEESSIMPITRESDAVDSTGDVATNENSTKKCQLSLAQELLRLSKYGWYWGSISGNEADAKLTYEPDGAFLIRDSSDHRYLLTLSFKSAGKLLHARIEYSGGMFSLCNQGDSGRFPSVPALIDHSINRSKSAVSYYSRPRYPGHPAFPVRLTKPVSRFSQVRSLQYLCRFVIRQHMRRDNICKLPLPESIKGYVEEGPYY